MLALARAAGVARVLVPGYDLESSRAALALAGAHDLDAAAGIHPHAASGIDAASWSLIEMLAEDPRVVAIGETGLDYDRMFSPREAQLAGLRRHLALGRATGKPVILHCRSAASRNDAHEDLLRLVAEAGAPAGLLHSFSGSADYAREALALGLAVSFSGLVFRTGEEASAEVARLVPADRLLVETDSPYLTPRGAPRGRNEPRWVSATAAWLAEQRGDDPAALGEQLVANYDSVFSRARNSSRPAASSW